VAASTAGALKAYIESLGLSLAVYRGKKPEAEKVARWVEVTEDISTVPDGVFNAFDDPDGHVSELAGVDLYQRRMNPATGANAESYTLPDALTKALNGARLVSAPTHVVGVTVVGRNRVPDPDTNVVHHALTVQIKRTLTAV
jgi:hypothetical protein